MNHDHFIVPPGKKIRLKDYDPGFTSHYKNKDEASAKLRKDIKRLAKYQTVLYAQNTYALLVMLQAMDTAGKDGAIRHVMSGVNPQGTQVHSFKAPSAEELDHDFLWRGMKALPERGGIGIFNRSYYEEVLVVRVHPEILDLQRLPPGAKGKNIWKHRFDEINSFEKYLGVVGSSLDHWDSPWVRGWPLSLPGSWESLLWKDLFIKTSSRSLIFSLPIKEQPFASCFSFCQDSRKIIYPISSA
jgi:polyphosphate kinase 2 (PPK2 family)